MARSSVSVRADVLRQAIDMMVILNDLALMRSLRHYKKMAKLDAMLPLERTLRGKLEAVLGKDSFGLLASTVSYGLAPFLLILEDNPKLASVIRMRYATLFKMMKLRNQAEQRYFVALCEAFAKGKITLQDIPKKQFQDCEYR